MSSRTITQADNKTLDGKFRYYQFSNIFWENAEKNELFQEAVRLAVSMFFFPDPTFFRGDCQLFDKVDVMDLWDVSKKNNLFLPHLSYAEDPKKYINNELYEDVKRDFDDRQYFIDLWEKNGDLTAKYTYLHCCQAQAALITYLACKINLPQVPLYLWWNGDHTVLTNTKSIIPHNNILNEYRSSDLDMKECNIIFDPIAANLPAVGTSLLNLNPKGRFIPEDKFYNFIHDFIETDSMTEIRVRDLFAIIKKHVDSTVNE